MTQRINTVLLTAAILGAVLALGSARAQTAPDGPQVSPLTAPNTTAVGRTKPAGAPLDDRGGLRPDLDRKEREIERTVTHSVCKTTSCL